jgi:hypothetical protein
MPARLRLSCGMKTLKLFLVPVLESLEFGRGVILDGTANDGLAIITYIKDARNLPWQKTSRDLSSTGAEQ